MTKSLTRHNNYKLDEDVYSITWTNMLKFDDKWLAKNFEEYIFETKDNFEYDCNIDYDKLNEIKNVTRHKDDDFPYNPLNIDESLAIVYKDELTQKWKMITMDNFSTNQVYRCQQGTLTQYELKIGVNYDLILFIDFMSNNDKYNFYYNKFKELKQTNIINYDTKTDDLILNLLFRKAFHFYTYNSIKLNKECRYFLGVKLIDYDYDINNKSNFLLLKYQSKTYIYKKDFFTSCCGHGSLGTFILLRVIID